MNEQITNNKRSKNVEKQYYIFKLNTILLNIVAIIIVIPLVVITNLISPTIMNNMINMLGNTNVSAILLLNILGYMILHELIHALGYIIHGADPKKITFGMELEKGVLYCLCKQDVKKHTIMNAVMYPLFWIGIVTYIISIIFNLPLLLLLSIINISGAAGDIMYFCFFLKLDKDIMFSEMDDGTSFAILSAKNISKKKFLRLEFVDTANEIPRNDFKRVKISKISYMFLALIILLLLINFLN